MYSFQSKLIESGFNRVVRYFSSSSSHLTSRPAPSQAASLLEIGTRSILTSDHDIFRTSVRKFMREELYPLQTQFEQNGQPSRDIWKALGNNGLLGVNTPAEVGGVGGSFIDEMVQYLCHNCTIALWISI